MILKRIRHIITGMKLLNNVISPKSFSKIFYYESDVQRTIDTDTY